MVYYIDGHNLIPKIPGMSLKQMDDEEHLLELLSEFARLKRKSLEVYFDKAPDGHSGTKQHGLIRVHYVTHRTIADEAIIHQVLKAGRRVSEIVVVSSDNHVIRQCTAAGAKTQTSDQFANELIHLLDSAESSGQSQMQHDMSPTELEEWLRIFGER